MSEVIDEFDTLEKMFDWWMKIGIILCVLFVAALFVGLWIMGKWLRVF